MKYRWLLGLLLPLTACGKDGSSNSGGTGGSTQTNSGGSSTNPGLGGSTGSGATGATGNGGSGNSSQGGSSQAGSNSGNRGGSGNSMGGGSSMGGSSNPGGGTQTGGQSGASTTGGSGGSTGGSGGSATTGSASVLERNGGPTREGHWIQPALTKSAAAKMTLESAFKATFKGNMYASPLYVENGPGGKGVFIAVSTDNVVAALDETDGHEVWSKSVGSSPGAAGQGCNGRDPVGILSTPVIDEKSGTIYVAAAIGTSSLEKHEVHALSIMDGSTRAGWPVNVSAMKAGSVSFATKYQNQRSALSLVNGIVYVAYGGFVGDCGDYHGWVVAIDTSDPTKTGAFATAGSGEAIWASGGFASDGTAIFPVTGNNNPKETDRSKSDSEAVLKITGLAQFTRNNMNTFYPAAWKSMDQADADLGGSNSMLVKIPGPSMPERALVVVGKDGKMYLLDPNNLGGSDGHLAVLTAATPSMPAGNGIKTAPTAYTTAMGTYVALTVQSAPDCPNQVTGAATMGVRITAGSPPTAEVAWCAPGPNPLTAPVSTTTDGKSDAIVWYVNNGVLKGVDGDTGATVFDGGSGSCSGVQRWTSPIAVKGRIIAGANGKLCSWKPM